MSFSSDYGATRSLKEVCASPDYFPALTALIGRMALNNSAPNLVMTLREATRSLGADASFFASFMREDDEHFDSFRLLVACDPVWSLQYEWNRCVAADPWLRYARTHSEPALALKLQPASDREQRTIDLAKRHGFASAFIVPAPASGGSRVGVLVLGSRRNDFFDGESLTPLKVIARGLAMELHERFAALMQEEFKARCELTSTDLEMLAHQRAGRPTKVIARLLGCSANALDQRFHRLSARMGVTNRGQAARLAAAYGLI